MVVVLFAVAGIAVFGMHFVGKGINHDYIDLPTTTAIKGIFVLLVFLRHYKGYVTLEGVLDRPFLILDNKLGQLIVALFLFYSGYGLYESVKKKGTEYINSIPKKRFLTTLIHFDFAILLYLLVQAIFMGNYFEGKQILFSLIAWNSVGNSNWFIFAMLFLYLASWIALKFVPSRVGSLCAVTVFSGLYALLFHYFYPELTWWYDTIFCYAAGMWYSLLKPQIEEFLSKEGRFWGSFAVLLIAFRILFYYRNYVAVYELLAIVFCLLGILVTMKVSVGNQVLMWLGKQVFTVYILQRLPMMILEKYGLSAYPYAFFILSLTLTLVIAAVFDWCLKKFDRFILKIPSKR